MSGIVSVLNDGGNDYDRRNGHLVSYISGNKCESFRCRLLRICLSRFRYDGFVAGMTSPVIA